MLRRWFSSVGCRPALLGGYCLLIAAMLVAPPASSVSYAAKKKEPDKKEPDKKNSKPASNQEADRQFADRMAAGGAPAAAPGQPAAGAATDAGKPLNLLELWEQGGLIMVPITAMSFIVVLFACERFLALRRGKVIPRRLVREMTELAARPGGLDPRQAFQLCKKYPSTAARVLNAVLQKVGRPHLEVEQALAVASEREAAKLWKNVRPITLATSIAPLLGLLGTVEGIIICFHRTATLAPGVNKSQELAHGIYVALVSTFGGLAVAIPAAILAHYFEGKIQSRFRQIDDLVLGIMPQLERLEGKVRIARGSSDHGESSSRSGGESPSKRQPIPGS